MSATLTKEHALRTACELAARFGFVSRVVVWRHLCPPGPASTYRYWRYLSNAPEFSPFKVGLSSRHHLVLSPDCKKAWGKHGVVSNRSAVYFQHDEFLMDLILLLRSSLLLARYWTEQELRMDSHLALKTLGGDSRQKMPDLIIDLKSEQPVRVAVEIEKTRKSQTRYRLMQMAYKRLSKIDLLLFGVIDQQTEITIRECFERGGYNRPIGFFLLGDFANLGLNCELRIDKKSFRIVDLLTRICKFTKGDTPSPDKNGIIYYQLNDSQKVGSNE